MTIDDPRESEFMRELLSMTGGDTETQVSMYDVGEALGLEKGDASALAQDLIINEWVELKSLSGGIGITPEGIKVLGGGEAGSGDQAALSLGTDMVLSENGSRALQEVLTRVKNNVPQNSARYDLLEELVVDIKTIDTQLLSPRPKTAVIREALLSIGSCLKECGMGTEAEMISRMASQ